MTNSIIDYLIVGQGLAGSLLGWTLHQQGHSIAIIDNHYQTSASMIAAGFMNYVSGKRFTLTWEAHTLIPFAQSLYQSIEKQLNTSILFHYPEYRIFTTQDDLTLWNKKHPQEYLQPYKGPLLTPSDLHPIQSSLNGVQINGSSMVNIPQLLHQLSIFFKRHHHYINTTLHWHDIHLSKQTVQWQGLSAKKIILCVGSELANTPWFTHIPYRMAKGETLTLSLQQKLLPRCYNFGKWLIPFNNHWRLGATYEWNELNYTPTQQGKEHLTNALSNISLSPQTIYSHNAAIRCITPDNAPLIGTHPDHPRLHVFSGLGSKGVMIAPYYAAQFTKYLTQKDPISDHVNITRY